MHSLKKKTEMDKAFEILVENWNSNPVANYLKNDAYSMQMRNGEEEERKIYLLLIHTESVTVNRGRNLSGNVYFQSYVRRW